MASPDYTDEDQEVCDQPKQDGGYECACAEKNMLFSMDNSST